MGLPPVIRKIVFLTLLYLVVGCSNSRVLAQLGNYTITHYGETEGLIQNSINDFLPDKNDFLIVATEGGICRFNGHAFLPFKNSTTGHIAAGPSRIRGLFYKGSDTILAYNDEKDIVTTIVKYTLVSTEKYDVQKHGLLSTLLATVLPGPGFIKNTAGGSSASFMRNMLTLRNHFAAVLPLAKDTIAVLKENIFTLYTHSGLLKNIPLLDGLPENVHYINGQAVMINADKELFFLSAAGLHKKMVLEGLK